MLTCFDVTDYNPYPEFRLWKSLVWDPAYKAIQAENLRLNLLLSVVNGVTIDRPAPEFTSEEYAARVRLFGYDSERHAQVKAEYKAWAQKIEAAHNAWADIYVTLP